MHQKGYFVLSLDFELYWGMFDKVTLAHYGERIAAVHTVLPQLLRQFEEQDIHATWATVGMLLYPDKATLVGAFPPQELQPQYDHMPASSYEHLKNASVGNNESDDVYHFGRTLAQQILQTEGQEFASHTFSHYYCLDGSKNGEAIFAADCSAMEQAAHQLGSEVHSIVFPRNQITDQALRTCAAFNITTYRGTEHHFLYKTRKESEQTNLFIRGLRLLDHYINLSGHHTYPLASVQEDAICNVRASRFLRPYSHALRLFEQLRLRRIKQSMTHAAKNNEIYHLWWHPHNFGGNTEENMNTLKSILEHFAHLQKEYGMESKNMEEVSKAALHA